jgi:endonuclease/exonuclease/phosphatase family metal-dependent hydrolase
MTKNTGRMSMTPDGPTFIAMTYNLWGDAHADARAPALHAFMKTRQPDLVATQELRPWSREALDDALIGCRRVHDTFEGWSRQSNLWWRESRFAIVEYGADDVGILDTDARLFWVRLRERETGSPLLFATAHLTWPGHRDEQADLRNRRALQAARIVERLGSLSQDDAPCLFTCDINDIGPANWAFGNAGFLDSFSALGQHSPVTHPVVPIPYSEEVGTRLSPLASPQKAIDWLFHRGRLICRSSEVGDYFHHGSAPSDHRPVLATYTIPGSGIRTTG